MPSSMISNANKCTNSGNQSEGKKKGYSVVLRKIKYLALLFVSVFT